MNIFEVIKRGDINALKANEYQIIQNVNDIIETNDTERDNYITYWMASHKDPEISLLMFEVFMNTCKTAFKPEKYEEVMKLYTHPTMIAAVAWENIHILDVIKDYLDKDNLKVEMYAEYGDICSLKLMRWYNKNFS